MHRVVVLGVDGPQPAIRIDPRPLDAGIPVPLAHHIHRLIQPFEFFSLFCVAEEAQLHRRVGGHQRGPAHANTAQRPAPAIVVLNRSKAICAISKLLLVGVSIFRCRTNPFKSQSRTLTSTTVHFMASSRILIATLSAMTSSISQTSSLLTRSRGVVPELPTLLTAVTWSCLATGEVSRPRAKADSEYPTLPTSRAAFRGWSAPAGRSCGCRNS